MKRFALILGCLLSLPASAGLSVPGALNYDSSFSSEFRAGDKPVAGGSCPTGWTCAVTGDATQDIDEVSATSFLMVVSGTDEGSIGYAYKNTASDDDVEIIARVPAAWAGNVENDTQFGVMLLDNAGYRAHCYWRNGSGNVKFKVDVDGAGEVQQGGLANQARPRYIGLSYLTTDTIGCFESSDGAVWTQVGTHVSKVLSFAVKAGVYGTSYDPIATATATPTGIAFSNTPTIEVDGGGGNGDPNNAPVFNATPVVSCTVGSTSSISLANSTNTADTTRYASDADANALTFTSQGTALPTGVSIDNTNYEIDCAVGTVAGTTAGVIIGVSDGVAARVDSSAFAIVVNAAGGGAEDATIIWTGLLEDGTLTADFKEKIGQEGVNSVVSIGPTGCAAPRQGTYMAKMEIPAGAAGTPQRAEIKSSPNVDFLWDETEFWVGFSFCVPATLTGVNTLFQIHNPNEGPGDCDMAGNPLGIHFARGDFRVINNPSGISEASGANSNTESVYLFDLENAANQDQWHDVIVNFSLSKNGNGFYNLWHNNTLVASGTGLSNVNWKDACGNVIQPPKDSSNGIHIGLYKSSATPGIVVFDAMRVAEGDNGYNTVDPAQDD